MRPALNHWPALSDLLIVLFLGGLISAQALDRANNKLVAENIRLQEENDALKRDRIECDPKVADFVDAFASCVEAGLGKSNLIHREVCGVSIGEDVLQFDTIKATPNERSLFAATVLSECLYTHIRLFQKDEYEAFNAIKAIYIDGHTDCEGFDHKNMKLGAARALYLYDRFVEVLLKDKQSSIEDDALLRKINIRSFGSHAPTPDSQCPQQGQWSDDRRVQIVVVPNVRAGIAK